MSISTQRPPAAREAAPVENARAQLRRLRILAVTLAVVAVGLAGLVVAGVLTEEDGAATDAPEEVVRLVDDFARAFEQQDGELMRSILTEDFAATSQLYNPDTAEPSFTAGATAMTLIDELRNQSWDVSRTGAPLVAGDSPWIVATRETWSDRLNRDEGVRLYLVVDDGGTPKIAGYYYGAVMFDVVPDFGS